MAEALEAAIVALLDARDLQRQQAANQWVNAFASKPEMWTAALYLAFPPEGSSVGRMPGVKFFVLNLLLSKLRSDWMQLDEVDASEIFEVLVRQLPKNLNDKAVSNRVCVVVSAAAAVAGGDACAQLVTDIIERSDVNNQSAVALALDLLTALAEEILHRPRTLPWEVGQCMQFCYPRVLAYLEAAIRIDLEEKAFVCLERWIHAGITLSDVYSDYPSLFNALLASLGSASESCVLAASTTLSELVSAVDLLPSRDNAVRALISAVLRYKGYFASASSEVDQEPTRSHAHCCLVSAIGCAECALISRGGPQELLLLDWMVEATGGGGGLGIKGATMMAEVWPRLAAVPSPQLPRKEIFLAVYKAIVKVAMYRPDPNDIDEDDFDGFRGGIAEDALTACFKVLGPALLTSISESLLQANTWQHGEVYLYTISSLSGHISQLIKKGAQDYEQITVVEFLKRVFTTSTSGLPSLLELVSTKWPDGKLVKTAAILIKGFAEWIALDPVAIEKAVSYSLTALAVADAKAKAAEALRELCRASAPHLAAARALSPLIGACEQAIVTSLGGLQAIESIALIEGLAAVAAALPVGEAEATIAGLTVSAVATIKELSVKQERTAEQASAIGSALRVITAVVDSGAASNSHPAIPVLREIWSALDILSSAWSGNAVVATSLCDLWSALACRIGILMQDVLPRVVSIIADMFKQHRVPSCIYCLSSAVALAPSQITRQELTFCLSTTLQEVTGIIEQLELTANSREIQQRNNALESLGAICCLGLSCLRHIPHIFVLLASFPNVFRCALGLVLRGDSEPALHATKFLSEAIFCGALNDVDCWRLPGELLPYIEKTVVPGIRNIVEAVLKSLAHGQLTVLFKESLADILFSLALKHKASTEAALSLVLDSANFPARPGILNDGVKKQFVAAAIHRAPRSRRVFQELMIEFSRVVQALSPAEVLFDY